MKSLEKPIQFSFNSSPRHGKRGFKGEKYLQIVLKVGEEVRWITLARIFAGKKEV